MSIQKQKSSNKCTMFSLRHSLFSRRQSTGSGYQALSAHPGSDDEEVTRNDELPLPDVVLCSTWTASVLRDRRRERKRHPAGKENSLSVVIEPLTKDLHSLSLEALQENEKNEDQLQEDDLRKEKNRYEEPPQEDNRQEDDFKSGGMRRRSKHEAFAKLSSISAAASVPVNKAERTFEDTPAGITNFVRNIIEPWLSN